MCVTCLRFGLNVDFEYILKVAFTRIILTPILCSPSTIVFGFVITNWLRTDGLDKKNVHRFTVPSTGDDIES